MSPGLASSGYPESTHSLHALGSEDVEDDRPPSRQSIGQAKPNEAKELLNASAMDTRLPGIHYDASVSFRRRMMTRYRVESSRRPLLMAGIKGALLFLGSFFGLVLLLKVLLPPLDAEHAPKVKVPKSFDDLKALNEVLHIYNERNFWRVLASFCSVYLMLQAFSLPGSMYMSILGGSIYGYPNIFLCCSLVATGASLCYAISALLGPTLLSVSDKWQRRVDKWTDRVIAQGSNLFSYLVILRIAPLPPHWVLNVIAPHLGIGIPLFWTSTWAGVFGVTTIHTTIGLALDDMTSPADFHLISWKNALGLGAVICAVSVPVILRRKYGAEVADAATADDVQAIALPIDADEALLPTSSSGGRTLPSGLREARLVFLREDGQVDQRRVAVRPM